MAVVTDSWSQVPYLMEDYFIKSAVAARAIQREVDLPSYSHGIYFHPETKRAWLGCSDPEPSFIEKVASCDGVEGITLCPSEPPLESQEPWVLLKSADFTTQDAFRPMVSAYLAPQRLLGGPNPLASALVGGLLGGGLGYGAGTLLENLFPRRYMDKGRLRHSLALLGGGLGAAPGLYVGGRVRDGGFTQKWMDPYSSSLHKEASCRYDAALKQVEAEHGTELPSLQKQAFSGAGGAFLPRIPVNEFNQTVLEDPRTSAPVKGLTLGLTSGASMQQGGIKLVSPADIARVAIGAGSGAVSGLVVGKTLGALAGITPDAQKKLQETGVWAGILSNVVPMVLR